MNVGIRSLKIPEYIADKIVLKDSTIDYEKALELANTILNNGKIKTTIDKATKEPVMKALFFISNTQAEKLADIAVEGNVEDKNIIQKILRENPAIDIALFGRMVADDPSLNEDASCQVATQYRLILCKLNLISLLQQMTCKKKIMQGLVC